MTIRTVVPKSLVERIRMNLYLEKPMVEQINAVAETRKRTPSGVARELLEERLAQLERES